MCTEKGWDWKELRAAKARVVDQLRADFVQKLHGKNRKDSLRIAKHAVLFTQTWRPRLRKSLQCTWQTLRAWEEQQPSSFRAPVPLPILAALVCAARRRAYFDCEGDQRELWLSFAALLLVGFFGLLRPGELLALLVSDVSLPNSLSLGAPFAVLRIQKAKNARQMGLQQFAEVRHPDAINWLSWLVEKRHAPRDRLWKGNPTKFRVMFRRLTKQLQIESLQLSPASLRAGGATWMLDERVEVSRIRFSGRWANLRSLEHYLQVARAQQIAITLPQNVAEHVKQVLVHYGFMLCLPHFLMAQVSAEHLVPTRNVEFSYTFGIAEGVRAWGRASETIQEGNNSWGPTPRSKIPGRGLGRFAESSTAVQDGPKVQPVRKKMLI